jgi:hypothetical protein
MPFSGLFEGLRHHGYAGRNGITGDVKGTGDESAGCQGRRQKAEGRREKGELASSAG